MPVTVPFDLGDDACVLLVPRRHGVFAKVGIVAEVTDRPGRRRRGAFSLVALHAACPALRIPIPTACFASTWRSGRTSPRSGGHARNGK
jgi:hypothetical protein